jgi:hypothetical protein
VLFGGVFDSWGGSDIVTQRTNANTGTGTHTVLDHDYRQPGQVLSPYDITLAKTPGAILQLNWKPAWNWGDAGGSNATTNSQIDAMANSIKSLGNHTIFLTVFHEPENDVTSDPNCPNVTYKGSAGTPTQYRAMWANVEARFAALGVTNVVWVMNYMNYGPWDCLVNDLWPGNNLVDWVFYESYSDDHSTFQSETGRFYNLLTNQSNSAHDYLSKPWGIGEMGTDANTASIRDSYFSGAKAALDANMYPKLRLYSVYDYPTVGPDFREAMTPTSAADPAKLADFMKFATDPQILQGEAAANAS